MVGNKVACAAYDKEFPGKIFRFVNCTDPVPMLPTMSLVANDYVHCDKEMDAGRRDVGGPGGAVQGSGGPGRLDGVISGSDDQRLLGGHHGATWRRTTSTVTGRG